MDDAIAVLKAQGATVVDVDIPSIVAKEAKDNLLLSGQSSVLNYGMKRDFNKWLSVARRGRAGEVAHRTS